MDKEHVGHEPLIRMSKRGELLPAWKAWGIRVIAFFLSLVVSGIVIVAISKLNPAAVFATMLDGAIGSNKRMWVTVRDAMTLLCIAVGLAPAFKMRFWNIGAEGQVLMGGLATASCMILFGNKLPSYVLLPLVIVASIAAAAIWALIPAVFKAIWNTNETLFTLMMNYIAIQIVSYFTYIWSVPKGSGKIGVINPDTQAGWLPIIGKYNYLLNILIVAALTVAIYIYLRYSKHGYEIAVVGESENTAKYIGINVRKVIIRTMLLSGALCGVAGLLLVSGTDHTITRDTAGGRGFTAIMVSWLAKFNPLYMILTSLLLVFMQKGATEISTVFGLNDSFSDIITGIIIFFIIGSEFFINYSVRFRSRKGAEAK